MSRKLNNRRQGTPRVRPASIFRQWRGAAVAERYMKSSCFVSLSIVFGILLACAASPCVATAQQKAPTGTYSPPPRFWRNMIGLWETNSVADFTLRFETNGTYVAQASQPRYSPSIDGMRLFSYPDIVRGTWRWNAQAREFFLEPGKFTFFIKRLPLDKTNPDHLVWGSSFLERREDR